MKVSQLNLEKCNDCGLCITICPQRVIEKDPETERPRLTANHSEWCIQCTQCMAICPLEAITIAGFTYARGFGPIPEKPADASAFKALLETRRSIRRFTNQPVSDDQLEEIVRMISLAPMGLPPPNIEISIVNGHDKVQEALGYMINFYDRLITRMEKARTRIILRSKMSKLEIQTLTQYTYPLMLRALPELKTGSDLITYNAPAIIIFHADKLAPYNRENSLIAITYGLLAAHSLGLGACITILVPPAVQGTPILRKMFQIPAKNQVFGCILIGHSRVKFNQRTIKRELKSVKWI